MPRLNENYLNLKESYLFSEIAHRTAAYAKKNPEKGARIIRLGIGDVTRPLGKAVLEALHEGVDAMGKTETFHGYGPEKPSPPIIKRTASKWIRATFSSPTEPKATPETSPTCSAMTM